MKRALLTAATALAFLAVPATANDSEAEWALGGLVLKENADISMDSEDLYISAKEVRVAYRYTNHAATDREVVIAFPLPALPEEDGYFEYESYPDWDELSYETTVNGQKVDFEIHDRALVGTRDVTALVEAEGWQVHWYRDYNFADTVQALPEGEKQRLLDAGLLTGFKDDYGVLRVAPAWRGQRHLLRVQNFPAGKSVTVTHRYTPIIGGSVGGMLYTAVRESDYGREAMAEYRKQWCIDDSFLAGVDRKLARTKPGHTTHMSETWLGYVLSSGANWRGPIKHFRLVVDKGDTNNLVSFCMNGVKKIAPTQFEVVKTDFEPEGDLDILIAQFFEVED
ncbi:MAG: DUF4424 family protein [Sphingomonadaceae bacterium]|nr:DUF4424 family protein [Sphingomonadaceae bacterium]MCP5383409.1 DUF4424 family protein [Altererythrobacter sp.]MCP5393586.1 DUF4424 family protein [Sphingomonadaceae bacterium]